MFIELIDLLRCPRDHEETWLVAAFSEVEERFVIEAKLGCPVCGASYRISKGTADFRPDDARPPDAFRSNGVNDTPGDDETTRYAAMLGLERPGALIMLEGDSARMSAQLAAKTEARVIAVNPSSAVDDSERVATVLMSDRMPLRSGSVDGIVLVSREDRSLDEAARVLKPGGRLVVSTGVEIGGRFRELARDDRNLVAESPGRLVPLTR